MPIKRQKGESKKDFVSRCIAKEIDSGIKKDQAAAICFDNLESKGTNMKKNNKHFLKNMVKEGIKFSSLNTHEGMSHSSHALQINGSEFKIQTINGETYLVAPVVLIAEGVLNGRYYPAKELKRNVQAWNGRPVPINHPKDQNGNPISANSVDVLRKDVVGSVYGVKFEPKTNSTPARLKGKIYLNEKQVLDKSPELWTEIENNENIEVSTGLYTQDIKEKGEFVNVNGKKKKYAEIAVNYLPDHLAALPGGIGACSWEDGCGIRGNADHGTSSHDKPMKKKKKKRIDEEEEVTKNDFKSLMNHFGSFLKDKLGLADDEELDNNELSHAQIQEALRGAVLEGRSFSPDTWVWIRQAFDNRFVYSVEDRKGEPKLFEQQYTIDQDDEIVLIGEAVEVEENITFEPVTNDDNTMKGDVMKEQMIKKIIANDNNEFTEEDESVLNKMNEDQLKGLSCDCDGDEEGDEGGEEEPPKANAEEEAAKAKANAEKEENNDDELVTMSKSDLKSMIQETVSETIKSNSTANDKAPLIAALKANGVELEEDEIKALSLKSLQKMADKSTPKGNKRVISQVPGAKINANDDDEDDVPDMEDFVTHVQEHASNN